MKQYARKKPYTATGIVRMPCTRFDICGNKAYTDWQICADRRLYRPVCKQCDIELNEIVMRWAFGSSREDDLKAYRESKL